MRRNAAQHARGEIRVAACDREYWRPTALSRISSDVMVLSMSLLLFDRQLRHLSRDELLVL